MAASKADDRWAHAAVTSNSVRASRSSRHQDLLIARECALAVLEGDAGEPVCNDDLPAIERDLPQIERCASVCAISRELDMTALSLRRYWVMYKRILVKDGGLSRRDQVLAQAAFYAGARVVLKVLNHLLEHGEDEELHRTIQRQGLQIKALQGLRPRARRH
jgi:hypothetical protein